MSQPVALVLDGHGWAARATVRSLAQAGWSVLAPKGTKSARSRFCRAAVVVPSYGDSVPAFTEAVAGLIERHRVKLVVPAEDASLQLSYETRGLLRGAQVLGGDRGTAELVLDKRRTLEAAAQAGFPVPRYVSPERVDEGVAASRELGYPCVIKPRRSYARTGAGLRSSRLVYASSEDEVRRALEGFLAQGFDLPLVQEWVPGRSIGVAAVVRRGRVLAWGAREAFSQLPIRGGSAVWRTTVGPETPGVHRALELFREVGFEGLGDVQYHIARDGHPRLMEMGARIYGWLPLTIAAGADLPAIAAAALAGNEPEDVAVARPGLDMRWLRGEVARLVEAAHPRAQLPPQATRRDVVRQLWPLVGRRMLYDGIGTGDRWHWRRSQPPARRPRLTPRAQRQLS